MIQDLIWDDDDNPVLQFDEEGIEYMMDGLIDLADSEIGTILTTPCVWSKSAPWWRFWDRSKTPMVGSFKLKRVA